MARADSTVRVNVVGDASKLQGALKKGEKSVGRFNSTVLKAGGVIAGAFAVDAVIDFGKTALAEADRVGDATFRLEEQLGGLSTQLIDTADDFTNLGASKQDILELEAAFADVATALGVADPLIASFADDAAATASALALLGENDAATSMDLITKAAGGSSKAMKALGISVTDAEVEALAMATTGKTNAAALTEQELAAARLELVLLKLKPRLDEIATGQGDVEQKTAAVQAKIETLQAEIGGAVEGPLSDLLDWILSGIAGWGMLGEAVDQFRADLGQLRKPVEDMIDLLGTLAQLVLSGGTNISGILPSGGGGGGGGNRPSSHAPHPGVTIQVQGGSPEVIEQAVRRAHATINGRSGPQR